MTSIYVTIQNDRVDKIAKSVYRTEHNGNTEAIFDANPGLAQQGEYLPLGLILTIPDRPIGSPDPLPIVRLWD